MNWKQLYASLTPEERFYGAIDINQAFELRQDKLISWQRIIYLTIFESTIYTVSVTLIMIMQHVSIKYSIPFMTVYLIGLIAVLYFKPQCHLISNYLIPNSLILNF